MITNHKWYVTLPFVLLLATGWQGVAGQSSLRGQQSIGNLACTEGLIASPTQAVQVLAKGIRLKELSSKHPAISPADPSWACVVGMLAHRADSDNRARTLLEMAQNDGSRWQEFAIASLLLHLNRPSEALAAIQHDTLSPYTTYERARAKFMLGDLEGGWRDLQTVAAAPQSLGAVLFGYDSEGVMDSTTERHLAAADPSEFTSILLKLWTRLAARSGVSVPERLAEHYKRLQYANSMYYEIPSRHNREDLRAIIPVEHEDRWRIYVRFGEPSEVIETMDPRVRYPTWIYSNSASDIGSVFNFQGVNAKYYLYSTIGCGSWMWDRVQVRAIFQRLFIACSEKPQSETRLLELKKEIDRTLYDSYRAALRTGSAYTPFKSELRYSFALYQFRSSDGRPEQVAVARVPRKDPTDSLGIILSVSDTLNSEANVVQSTLPTSTSGTGVMLSINSITDFVPQEYRITVRVPGKPIGRTYGGNLDHDPTHDAFAISDAVISSADGTGAWTRKGHRLSPIFAAPVGATVDFYYEVYGVQRTDTLDTTITWTDDGGLLQSDRSSSLTFSELAQADKVLPTMRKITLPDMKGDLTIKVSILNRRTRQTATTVAKISTVSR